MNSLRKVASLIGAVTILQVALGLLGLHLPLEMRRDGLSGVSIGLVGACYAAGFMAGAWFGPTLLARVGHIRVFAASAALIAATTLSLYAAADPISWSVLRAMVGGAVALLFAAADSWIGGSIGREERGGVIGVYQVTTKIGVAVGPFLALAAPGDLAAPFMIAGALCALSLVPVSLSVQPQPATERSRPLAIRAQFQTAPAAVIAAFFAGFINGAVMLLAPLFALERFGADQATAFQASAWIGSLILQWPAGRLSDRIDRRLVILGCTTVATIAATALALFESAPYPLALLLFALWGAGALSYYGVATAHMADRSEPGAMAQSASGLLFVWAAGSVIGPLIIGAVVDVAGQAGVFWFAAASGLSLAILMIQRRSARGTPARVESQAVAPQSATSVAAAEIAYGQDKDA